MKFIYPFLISLAIVYLITPLFIKIAQKANFYDHPNYRKTHRKDTPLLGGLPIFIAFLVVLFFFAKLPYWYMLIFLFGGVSITILGLIDDYIALRATLKFLLPLFSFLILVSLGLKISFLSTPLSFWFSLVWIMIISNAFNFIDNINGLSAGIASVVCIGLGILAIFDGQQNIAILSFGIAGAALGFLPHNFPKAKIFLGDTGSMFLGFIIASIVVLGHWDVSHVVPSFYAPIFILSYPIFDFCYATIRRLMNRQVPWIGDKNHSSHNLAVLVGGNTKAVLLLIIISIGLTAFGLWSRLFDFKTIELVLVFFTLCAILFSQKLSEVNFIRPKMKKGMSGEE